ncbi:MAG: arginine--tRNA ligase [Micavibrio sp.]|nr:MAG: arginine--tRNA ligase [Micavibrio sp.]
MASIAEKLTDITGAAFAALDLPVELGQVRVSDRPDLAQFQCNGAMAASKMAKKNPREIAQAVVEALQSHKEFSKIEIAGPGFINLNITDDYLASHLAQSAGDERLGVEKIAKQETIVLDYGGPNIAKPMHVGHLRSSIIGDSLRRICDFAGYSAIGDVHMGDWGRPMGMILSVLEARGTLGEPVTMDQLEEIYPAAAKACKEDEAQMEKAREATVKLQDGDETYKAAWKQFIDVSVKGMKKNFDALGVHFDLWKGEADVHELIAPMVNKLKTNGFAVESEGALVISVEQEGDKKEMPPLILLKSDGGVMYGTTDLATIVERMEENNPVKIIYVVDQRQSLHFEQVFRAAYKGGIVPENIELTHAGFGTMNGPDGKPFKTRAGGVMRLEDLISMGIEKAQARLAEADLARDMDKGERADIAQKVAIAAIKFADLQNNRIADYVFDIDRMTSFEGKTGPYLLYQAVRIKSLLRKAEGQGFKPGKEFLLRDSDRSLALLLTELPNVFEGALKNYTPHLLCEYAYRLAQEFSSFYAACHILSEEDEALRSSRLALCELTQSQIVLVLGLLGIKIPERM